MKIKRIMCAALAGVALALPLSFAGYSASAGYIETNGNTPPYGPLSPFGDMYVSYGAFGLSDYQGSGSLDYPTFTLPLPLFYGDTDEDISDDVFNENDIGMLGTGDLRIFQRMDSGLTYVRMSDFSTLWNGLVPSRPIVSFFNYTDIHTMRNVWKTYLSISSSDSSINSFWFFTDFSVSIHLRNRYESTWFDATDTFTIGQISDYISDNVFYIGEWFFPYLSDKIGATNYIPLINGERIPIPFGVESVVSSFFDFVDIEYFDGYGDTPSRTHLPLSYYGSISFSFHHDTSINAVEYADWVRINLGTSPYLDGSIRFTPADLESYLEDKRYYSTSSNFQDSVTDAVKSIFSVPAAFFDTPFIGNFTFGHLLILAFGCLMFGLGLKISLGG